MFKYTEGIQNVYIYRLIFVARFSWRNILWRADYFAKLIIVTRMVTEVVSWMGVHLNIPEAAVPWKAR